MEMKSMSVADFCWPHAGEAFAKGTPPDVAARQLVERHPEVKGWEDLIQFAMEAHLEDIEKAIETLRCGGLITAEMIDENWPNRWKSPPKQDDDDAHARNLDIAEEMIRQVEDSQS
jgi:hypothetical protein